MQTKRVGLCIILLFLITLFSMSTAEAKPLLGETIVFTDMKLHGSEVQKGVIDFDGNNTATIELDLWDGVGGEEDKPRGSFSLGPDDGGNPLLDSWNHGGLPFDQIKDIRVQVTFDFSYEIFNPGYGSIHVNIQLGNDEIFTDYNDSPNHVPTTHSDDHQIVSGETTLGDLFVAGRIHAVNGATDNTEQFWGTLTLHSVTVEFLDPLPYGTLSGTVRREDNNEPIEGLNVFASDYATNQWMAGTWTDSDGNYILFLPSGSYRVRACPSWDNLPYVDEFYDDTPDYGAATPVELTDISPDVSGIDFLLEEGGTISGTVKREDDNEPIEGLHVFATDYTTNQWLAGTNTDSEGNYSLRVPEGSYRVRACASCGDPPLPYVDEFYDNIYDYGGATPVEVTEFNDPSGIDFLLEEGGAISGTVYDEDAGTPITDVEIDIDVFIGDPCGDPQHVAHANTDMANGTYTLTSVPAETVYLRISNRGEPEYLDRWWSSLGSADECEDAEPLILSPGETRPDIDFQTKINPRVFEEVEGIFFSQWKTITIDGDYGDWDEQDRVYVDTNGPECNNAPGQDIKALYIAQDDEFIYLRYILNAPLDETFGYKLVGGHGDQKHLYVGQDPSGDAYIFFAVPPSDPSSDWTSENLPDEFVQVTGNQFECKIPKADVQMWSGESLMAWLDQGYETSCADHVQLPVIDIDYSTEPTGGLNVTTLISPAVRPTRNYTLWIVYANEGTFAIPDPGFLISNDSDVPMRLSQGDPFLNEPVSITGSGILSPGDERRIPVYFQVPGSLPSHHFIHFAIEKVVNSIPTLVAIAETEVIRPEDPNAKATTPGIGDLHYVLAGDELSYTVFFENVETATAPAQEVFITDALDPNLDWSTFQLGEVAFGDFVINDLAGLQSGETQVILNDDFAVDIIVEFDALNGVVHWTLRTIDRETGDLPEDPYAGFLPPNDATGCGEGHVTFSIQTRNDLSLGDVISNAATIVFDTEASIPTNEVFNTIGTHFPGIPTDPGISDGAIDVAVSTAFSWAASEYAVSYDLYLWDLSEPSRPALPTVADLLLPAYDPFDDLEYGTTYMWQVFAKNMMGEVAGLMWSFTTEIEPIEPVIPEPATLLLIGTGLFGILALMRRKRRQKK